MKVTGANSPSWRWGSSILLGWSVSLLSSAVLAQEPAAEESATTEGSIQSGVSVTGASSEASGSASADQETSVGSEIDDQEAGSVEAGSSEVGSSDQETSADEDASEETQAVDLYPYAGERKNRDRYDRTKLAAQIPYLQRWRPERNLFEAGLFLGILFPSTQHNLKVPELPFSEYSTSAVQFGGRFAYYPLSFAGAEIEAFAGGGSTKDFGYSALFYAVRAHAIVQLPLASVVPFLLVGGGTMGAVSEDMGHDRDPAFHFGAGVKAPVSQVVSVRFDVRDTLTQKVDAKNGRQTHHPELHLGCSFVFDRSLPELPPDTDYDGLFDNEDKCPTVGALTIDGCPADQDGDGVNDLDDECPAVVGEAPTGCPNRDEDGDGVPIPADQCPDEIGEAPTGCPERDLDGDGFVGDADQCPEKAETRNGFEDDDGCPDEMPEAIKRFTGVIAGINFKQGTSEIEPASLPTLDSAIEILKKYPTIRLEVSGHTSSEGTEERNQELSEERANAVRNYFLEKGIAAQRIVARGAGPSEPIADNSTKEGRQQNRRIEFRILSQP